MPGTAKEGNTTEERTATVNPNDRQRTEHVLFSAILILQLD